MFYRGKILALVIGFLLENLPRRVAMRSINMHIDGKE